MLDLLLLVIAANSAPVLARHLLGVRAAQPIDGGLVLRDGHALFGSSKTWRGLAAACLACAALAVVLGRDWTLGAAAGALAMAGDLLASFLKRRRGIRPSGRAPLLDSVPEALLPALVLRGPLQLQWLEIAALVVLFALIVRVSSPLLYRLHIRRHPW